MTRQTKNSDSLSLISFVGGNSSPANPTGIDGSPLAAFRMAGAATIILALLDLIPKTYFSADTVAITKTVADSFDNIL